MLDPNFLGNSNASSLGVSVQIQVVNTIYFSK